MSEHPQGTSSDAWTGNLMRLARRMPGYASLQQALDRRFNVIHTNTFLKAARPGHYYSPIPDMADVEARAEQLFNRHHRELPGIDCKRQRNSGGSRRAARALPRSPVCGAASNRTTGSFQMAMPLSQWRCCGTCDRRASSKSAQASHPRPCSTRASHGSEVRFDSRSSSRMLNVSWASLVLSLETTRSSSIRCRMCLCGAFRRSARTMYCSSTATCRKDRE